MVRNFVHLLVTVTCCFPVFAVESDKDVSGYSSAHLSGVLSLEGEGTTEFLPFVAQHSCHQPLFDLVYGYLDFCIDTFERYKLSPYRDVRLDPIYEKNTDTAQHMVLLMSMLDSGHETVPAALEKLLLLRLENIDRRAAVYLRTQTHFFQHKQPLTDGYFIPTSPMGIAMIQSAVDSGKAEATMDLHGAKEAINRYHFVNLLIYHLYKLVPDPTRLPLKVKDLISCSVTLHPLLLDQTTDLSYPDFATITYDEDPLELQNHKDYNYWWSNYKRQPYNVVLRNWCREQVTLMLTPVETQEEFISGNKVLPLLRPKWLFPDRSVSTPQPSGTTSSTSSIDEWLQGVPGISRALGSSRVKGSQSVAQRKGNNRKGQSSKVDQKKGHQSEGSSLGEAAAAAATAGNGSATKSSSVSTALNATTPNSKEEPLKTAQNLVNQNEGFTSTAAAAAAAAVAVTTPIATNVPSATTPNAQSLMGTSQTAVLSNALTEDQAVASQSVSEVSDGNVDDQGEYFTNSLLATELPTAVVQPPVMPRGVRVFHPKMASKNINKPFGEEIAAQLGGKWQNLVDTIFDHRMKGQGFNFGEFRSLWEHINGQGSVRSSGHGSSHYALLNRDGKVVLGTFAHGDGFQYSNKTVRYLRAALQLINVKPSILRG